MFCPNCGSQTEEQGKFCTRCGHPITTRSENPEITPPPTAINSTPAPQAPTNSPTSEPPPAHKIVTLPSGKKIKVKNDKIQSTQPIQPKERAPLTNLWAWLLAIVPPFTWIILYLISNRSVAFIGTAILVVFFALKDESVLEKAGYRKEAPDFKLALAFYPLFYLFIRAKRTNKNYGPAAISTLLCTIETVIVLSLAQAVVSDTIDVVSGNMTQEEFGNKWAKEKVETASISLNAETIVKLSIDLGHVNNGIMSKREFKARWGLEVSDAIKLLLDLERDAKRVHAGLMSEEDFKAKWE